MVGLEINVICPAYGRKYKSEAEVLKDWNAGKDFKVYPSGPYTSIRDRRQLGIFVDILYDGKRVAV